MSDKVLVGDEIELRGSAKVRSNVKGNILTNKLCYVDWFNGTTLDSNFWTETSAGTSAATALTAGGYCGVTHTTGTDDNAIGFLSTGLIFDASQNPIIEVKVNINDVTGSYYGLFFSDAISETTPAATIDYADGSLVAAATDAVGFVIDADKESSRIYVASIAFGGAVTATASLPTTAWTDGVSKTLRIGLDSDLSAYLWIDSVQVGKSLLAVTDVPLCGIINYGNRDGSSDVIYTRYFAMFQDIP